MNGQLLEKAPNNLTLNKTMKNKIMKSKIMKGKIILVQEIINQKLQIKMNLKLDHSLNLKENQENINPNNINHIIIINNNNTNQCTILTIIDKVNNKDEIILNSLLSQNLIPMKKKVGEGQNKIK